MSPLTHKEAATAFYRNLYLGRPYTDDEFRAAVRRLGIVRWKFMEAYNLKEHRASEDRGVLEPVDFLIEYMADGRFLVLRKKFEKMSPDHLLNYVHKMFKNYLIAWWNERERLRKAETLAYKRTEDGKTSRLYKRHVKGDIVPDYTEPETELARIASRAKVKAGRFAEYVQWLKDHPSNENKAKLRMINKELKRRAEVWHEDPKKLKRELKKEFKRVGEPLKIVDGIPVNKTQTLAWAGHHQKPRKRKTSN